MDTTKTTPRDFFLWVGAMLTLYGGVVAFLALIFDYINYAFPDPLRFYSDPYSGSAPYEMASLIVLAPVFLILMRVIRRAIAHDASRGEVWVRRWALFLTVFLAGATIVVDLIILLTSFLRGEELTAAFLLKVLVVLLVAGAGFVHFLSDLWGYWEKNPSYAKAINYAVGVLVAATVVAGFLIIGTPHQARLMRFDQQKVSDLQNIQSQVVTYFQQKQKLPGTLAELNDPLSPMSLPSDPQTGEAYTYRPGEGNSFELCAVFNAQSSLRQASMPVQYPGSASDNWQHAAGQVCFERVIDPERYPPYTKPAIY